MEHSFTPVIHEILAKHFGDRGEDIFQQSPLLQYINIKTKSASKGAKARASYANLYTIYVLLKDYIDRGFVSSKKNYSNSEGAKFSDLLRQARELPFGAKLQNHSFNNRLNDEFKKYFTSCDYQPVIRDLSLQRYWICENLVRIKVAGKVYCLIEAIVGIIDAYVAAKQDAFKNFTLACKKMLEVSQDDHAAVIDYIRSLLEPNVDARIFEIVSYAILKYHYSKTVIYWGWSRQTLNEESLALYKTGRTNANDGGIDFVMKPLGRFFQVTETLDLKKYFLDIDKVQRYPVSFVVKTDLSIADIKTVIESNARKIYSVEKVVKEYMECIEEIINIPVLITCLEKVAKNKQIAEVFREIIIQSEVEFSFTVTDK